MLRHRVVDLGFAINRALVFSALSFLLLASGVVEWASEKLLPFESHEVGLAINMAVALGIFMGFHRLHEWVEKGGEHLFFHAWRINSRALDALLAEAPYITRPDVPMERAIDEFRRFSRQEEVAVYRHEAGGYRLKAGSLGALPAFLDADEPELVALRARLDLLRDVFQPGTLLMPITHRAEVVAFVVMGAKPGGESYRPDEEEELLEATRRIGLDLHALRVEEQERENTRLSARIAAMA